jgi:hypothetical protein
VESAVERAATQNESVELLKFAVREERIFSQAVGPRGVRFGGADKKQVLPLRLHSGSG